MRNVVPTVVDPEKRLGRNARVSRTGDGSPIGAAVFFTADELEALGIDPDSTDTVAMQIHNGEVVIRSLDVDKQ